MSYEQANSYLQALRRTSKARQDELFRCVDVIEAAAHLSDKPEVAEALLSVAAKLLGDRP